MAVEILIEIVMQYLSSTDKPRISSQLYSTKLVPIIYPKMKQNRVTFIHIQYTGITIRGHSVQIVTQTTHGPQQVLILFPTNFFDTSEAD